MLLYKIYNYIMKYHLILVILERTLLKFRLDVTYPFGLKKGLDWILLFSGFALLLYIYYYYY